MTKNIDFYFDFISPYTYLGHKRIENEGAGIKFNYKPILLGGLHKLWNITPQAYIEPKKKFMIMDCELCIFFVDSTMHIVVKDGHFGCQFICCRLLNSDFELRMIFVGF